MTNAKILIVEDERIIARGIEKRLRGMGYLVAGTAYTGAEAVRLAAELVPDMVLMDINLGGGMNGVEAAELIHHHARLPVVFLTAFSDDATLERAKQAGPHGYVLKPFEDKDLQIAIEIGLYRHEMESRLRENEQWLAATLESIGDGVIATDERGRIRFVNGLAEQLTGWPQLDAVDRDVRDVFRIVNEGSRTSVQNPIFSAVETGKSAALPPHTLLIDRNGREKPIDDSAAPILDSLGVMRGAVLVFRDITERRRLEENLRQAQKMEAIGRLAGGVAHDFNNIMTVITGLSELMLLGGEITESQRANLQDIHDAGKRAAALTSQIMAYSRNQLMVPVALDLNRVIRDMGMMAKRLIGSNIQFEMFLAPDLGHVRADPSQLGQVILNMVVNARDAMPNGGRLCITTENVQITESDSRKYDGLSPGLYVGLSVTDNGSGIPNSILPHVFDPYFTTKGVGEGTGLGLATVYGIVKQSGGHIEVSSTPGMGTTFRVLLPQTAAETSAGGRDCALPASGNETILLVEDNPMVMRMTRTMLEQCGYHVLEASHGREALDLARSFSGRIDLLITDLVMPHLPGSELAALLSADRPALKVLFMSGYTEDVLVRQGIASGSDAFLQKPFGMRGLTEKVREVLDHSRSSVQ